MLKNDLIIILKDQVNGRTKTIEMMGYIALNMKLGTIDTLLIKSKFRVRGLGELLLKWALQIFRNLRYERVTLEVLNNNEKAINLYKKHGFIELSKKNAKTNIMVVELQGRQ